VYSPQNPQTQSVWGHETKVSHGTTNTQRLWSLTKPQVKKITTRLKANTFGFYAIKGNSVVYFKENSNKENLIEFFEQIRTANPKRKILIILDNFRSHHVKIT